MNAETAIQINQWIDRFHNPNYWIIFWVIALYILLEYRIFPQKKIVLNTIYSRLVLYAKFGVLLFTFAIALSQSVLGGCAIQLIQNYLAVQYILLILNLHTIQFIIVLILETHHYGFIVIQPIWLVCFKEKYFNQMNLFLRRELI
jgi:hypothetical protein